MDSELSAVHVVFLAAQYALKAEIDALAYLCAQYQALLSKDLILRILLTCLPETVGPAHYVDFVRLLARNALAEVKSVGLDTSSVSTLSDKAAAKAVRKLRLVPLPPPPSTSSLRGIKDSVALFLYYQARRIDQETGLLLQLPELLMPFLETCPKLEEWARSTVLPLMRRRHDYYPGHAPFYTLEEFEALPDADALDYLLAETGATDESLELIGRDLRGMVGPWLRSVTRWNSAGSGQISPAYDHVLAWMARMAKTNWLVAVKVAEQWDGPEDCDLGSFGNTSTLETDETAVSLQKKYARCALICAYLVPEATLNAIAGAHLILSQIRLPDSEIDLQPLPVLAAYLEPVSEDATDALANITDSPGLLRSNFLDDSNALTDPNDAMLLLANAIIVSAFLLTRSGCPCSIRRVGELISRADAREQKAEVYRLIQTFTAKAPRDDDEFWARARQDLLWLHDWGQISANPNASGGRGIFTRVPREYIETEMLAVLLSNSRFSLARSIYETSLDKPLSTLSLRHTILNAALAAFDHALNPNRTKGGLKKCEEILQAFPATIPSSDADYQQMESLLHATNILSNYRPVLKQGEPFSPATLRAHSDPISIVRKVLEQNPGSYTRIQDFLDLANNLIKAGLVKGHRSVAEADTDANTEILSFTAERRITAMCVEAALTEDDFETAYLYVARIGDEDAHAPQGFEDEWSWAAAFPASQNIRRHRSRRPTHSATASGNLDIRHLQQRLECLGTALRLAPAAQLQEILQTFCQCEEQLDSALHEEAAQEEVWDAAGDLAVPGSFINYDTSKRHRTGRTGGPGGHHPLPSSANASDQAPMSLFDLSRATVRVAQDNLRVLSKIQHPTLSFGGSQTPWGQDSAGEGQTRARKRDQLRDAAVGTLVSGVGWLINAPSRES